MMCPVAPMVAAAVTWIGLVVPVFGGDQPDRALDEAKRAIDHGDYDAAIARLDESIRLAPREAKLLGLRGMARLRKGEYAKGADDLKAAIALNPGDSSHTLHVVLVGLDNERLEWTILP